MKVLAIPEVRKYLYDLSLILYEKDYFETAEKYVDELFYDINTTLANRQKKIAPPYFEIWKEFALCGIQEK